MPETFVRPVAGCHFVVTDIAGLFRVLFDHPDQGVGDPLHIHADQTARGQLFPETVPDLIEVPIPLTVEYVRSEERV